jgi:hypothetical protein
MIHGHRFTNWHVFQNKAVQNVKCERGGCVNILFSLRFDDDTPRPKKKNMSTQFVKFGTHVCTRNAVCEISITKLSMEWSSVYIFDTFGKH